MKPYHAQQTDPDPVLGFDMIPAPSGLFVIGSTYCHHPGDIGEKSRFILDHVNNPSGSGAMVASCVVSKVFRGAFLPWILANRLSVFRSSLHFIIQPNGPNQDQDQDPTL